MPRETAMMQAAKDSIDLGTMAGDMQASLRFYHTLLGLAKIKERQASTGTLHASPAFCLAAAVKRIAPTIQPEVDPIGIDPQLGFRYLTFVVTHQEATGKRLEADGLMRLPQERVRLPWSCLTSQHRSILS